LDMHFAGGHMDNNWYSDWDIEIRKRYTLPLFTETHEFPDTTTIAARMLPICYENGLPSGHEASCPTFMNIATETYIKEALTNLLQRVQSNGPGHIRTAEFRRKAEKEEKKVLRGELNRTAGGLLPVEMEEARKRRPLCMEDLKLALELGDSYLGQVPLISGTITHGRFLDTPGIEELHANGEHSISAKTLVNGVNGTNTAHQSSDLTNGYHVDLGDPMAIDDDWQWLGGGVQDVEGLDNVLDACLAVGV
jgi:transcriptional coactivator HFI1/ADA1